MHFLVILVGECRTYEKFDGPYLCESIEINREKHRGNTHGGSGSRQHEQHNLSCLFIRVFLPATRVYGLAKRFAL